MSDRATDTCPFGCGMDYVKRKLDTMYYECGSEQTVIQNTIYDAHTGAPHQGTTKSKKTFSLRYQSPACKEIIRLRNELASMPTGPWRDASRALHTSTTRVLSEYVTHNRYIDGTRSGPKYDAMLCEEDVARGWTPGYESDDDIMRKYTRFAVINQENTE